MLFFQSELIKTNLCKLCALEMCEAQVYKLYL